MQIIKIAESTINHLSNIVDIMKLRSFIFKFSELTDKKEFLVNNILIQELKAIMSDDLIDHLYDNIASKYNDSQRSLSEMNEWLQDKYDIIFKDLSTMELVEYTESNNTDEILCIVPKEWTKAQRKELTKQLNKT